ncbi:polysaccharide lyase family 8 super-sandwich domain-containing protein [Paenibacillus sp. IITD108]|uniref:polysaccharide lyase family 8 super-sandwich domain-containing protein n=1 Tax=Paenibacillus sp. IITD108 TaxID=3116649 RepID=UPI002F3F21D6
MRSKVSLLVVVTLLVSFFHQSSTVKVVHAAEITENVIPNPGFEQITANAAWLNGEGAAGWGIWFATSGGVVSVDKGTKYGDNQSLKITHPVSTARTNVSVDNGVPIHAGETYKLSAWIKTDQVSNNGLVFRSYYYKDNVKDSNGPSQKLTGTNDWQLVELIAEAPANVNILRVEFMLETGEGTVWVDDASLVPYKAPKLWLDQSNITAKPNEQYTLKAEYQHIDVTESPLEWTSSDSSIVELDQQGVIQTLRAGSATIRVSSAETGLFAERTVVVESPEKEQMMDQFRLHWFNKLTGNDLYDSNDHEMHAAMMENVARVTNGEQEGVWDRLDTSPSRTYLWDDYGSTTVSAHITNSYSRLKLMALVYSYKESPLYKNEQLKDAIISGLDWMYDKRYNERIPAIYNNWYDWEIGTPKVLGDIMVLMYDELTAEQLERYIAAIDRFVPDPTKRKSLGNYQETGANLLDKAIAVTIRGIVGKSVFKVIQGSTAIGPEYAYVKAGDGVYEDGSLVQHTNIAYTGGYGSVWLTNTADMMYVLKDSPWEISDPQVNHVFEWIFQTYEPVIYKGLMLDMVNGRGISREAAGSAKGTILSIMRLAESAPDSMSLAMKRMVKEWVSYALQSEDYYSTMSIFDIVRLKAIMNDPAIERRGELVRSRVYAGMDRAIHAMDNYSFGVSMFSNRISAFEYGNGENKKGWYTGMGMTYLYNDDLLQYRDDFWPTVDAYRLAGTTTDGSYKAPVAWASYYNPREWVGGSSLEQLYSAVGMDFSLKGSTGSSLEGKKSWFMFDNEIVALGSGITGGDGREVETIIDNRKIKDDASNRFTVDDQVQDLTANAWEETKDAVRWAHLTGNAAGSDVGYYFPETSEAAAIKLKREQREGSWQEINDGQAADRRTKNYVSLAFEHGKNPHNESYAYVLLPNKDTQATKQYSISPDVEIVSMTNQLHAVKEKALGITAYNFFAAAQHDYVRTAQPASVIIQEKGNQLTLSIADPTQKQDKILLELGKEVTGLISKDDTVRIVQSSPYLKLEVHTAGSVGTSHTIKLSYKQDNNVPLEEEEPAIKISVSEDAYVNAGDSANKNFGSVGYLNIKNGQGNYLREVLLKYDISELTDMDAVDTVKLFVYSRINDSRGGSSDIGVYKTDHNWDEHTVTWDTKPAFGQLADRIAFTTEQKWRAFDVTEAVKTMTDLTQPISLALKQLTTDLSADIRSKENENGIYTSYLEVKLKKVEPVMEELLVTAPSTLLAGESAAVAVIGRFSNDSRTILTEGLSYESSNDAVASITTAGMLQTHAPGNTVITIKYGALTKQISVQVKTKESPYPPIIPSVPSEPSLQPGQLVITKELLERAKLAEGKLLLEIDDAVERIDVELDHAAGLDKQDLMIQAPNVQMMLPAGWLSQWSKSGTGKADKVSLTIENANNNTWENIQSAEAKRLYAAITSAAAPILVKAAWIEKDGQITEIASFTSPIIIFFETAEAMDRQLTAVYRITEQGELEYVGGKWIGGNLQAEVNQPGEYIALSFEKKFSDIADSHWAAAVVKQLAAKQLIQGVSIDRFQPERSVTRAEFTALLVRMLNIPQAAEISFTDVLATDWHSHEIALAVQAGIVQGTGNAHFKPDAAITRQEMAAMLVRAYEYKTKQKLDKTVMPDFKDTQQVPQWAGTAIGHAQKLGFIQGRGDGLFHPAGQGTRAESAMLIWRFLEISDKTK